VNEKKKNLKFLEGKGKRWIPACAGMTYRLLFVRKIGF